MNTTLCNSVYYFNDTLWDGSVSDNSIYHGSTESLIRAVLVI